MEQPLYNPLENPRMYKYSTLQKDIKAYLDKLKERIVKDEKSESLTLRSVIDSFPEVEPETPEEYNQFFSNNILNWLSIYDQYILNGYEESKAIELHDPDLCIPCHIGLPKKQPLFIQYLYSLQTGTDPDPWSARSLTLRQIPEQDQPLVYEDILKGVKELTGVDREKFIYELRFGILESLVAGEVEFEELKKLKELGPDKFYKSFLMNEDGTWIDQESQDLYQTLIDLAGKNEMHDFDDYDEDYVFETNKIFKEAIYRFHTAFYQLQMMRDLLSLNQ